jgi:ubiquinone/menaquinone biosynthesis C-methylase UbiE
MSKTVKDLWNKVYEGDVKNQAFNLFIKKQIDFFCSKLDKKSKILDIGCGNGEKTNYIFNKGYSVTGIDSSTEAIEYARKNFSSIKFVVGDVTKLLFEDSSFDAVISIAIYHCLLTKQRRDYIKQVKRVLKKGGLFYQLTLSSRDETKIGGEEIEERTFINNHGLSFHLSTLEELKKEFSEFEVLNLKHHQKVKQKKNVAVYTSIMRKK